LCAAESCAIILEYTRSVSLQRITCHGGDHLPDKETQKKAVGFLLVRFYAKVLKSGEHIEAALWRSTTFRSPSMASVL